MAMADDASLRPDTVAAPPCTESPSQALAGPLAQSAMQTPVLVTGATGVIGTRITLFLASAGFDVTAVESLTTVPPGTIAAVHLRLGPEQDQPRLKRLLAASQTAGVKHVTLVSSASVYGAWPDNSIPLSEDSPVRPNPETPFALRHAEAERMVQNWTGGTTAILRPAPVVSSPMGGPIGEAMLATAPARVRDDHPPSQFLHLDDLARAVVVSVQKQLSGVFNVSPNGWLSPAELLELLGTRPKRRLPWVRSQRLDRYVARRVGHEAPVGILPYTRYPWVISSDRLQAAGWAARYGNDEAFVHADVGMPWDDLNARQRQYVSLTVSGLIALGIAVGVVFWVRRALKRRQAT